MNGGPKLIQADPMVRPRFASLLDCRHQYIYLLHTIQLYNHSCNLSQRSINRDLEALLEAATESSLAIRLPKCTGWCSTPVEKFPFQVFVAVYLLNS